MPQILFYSSYYSIIYPIPDAHVCFGLKRGQRIEQILIAQETNVSQGYTHAQFPLKSSELLLIH